MSSEVDVYTPENQIRVVTATSLFDGHDAAINIMRRILQDTGVEVIHLGHNRSVQEIADAAIEEDVQGVAVSSYQGGHIEFFKYLVDLLKEKGAPHIKVFGGGGGTIRGGQNLDYLGNPNRQMCRLYLSMMDKMGVHLDRFGDADEPLSEV